MTSKITLKIIGPTFSVFITERTHVNQSINRLILEANRTNKNKSKNR